MQDVGYTVFMGFGGLWVLMGIAAVIFLFKSDGQKLRFGKWGLLAAKSGLPVSFSRQSAQIPYSQMAIAPNTGNLVTA